uniref:Methyltransferase domain-containing protein n=1 Tax=Candidatus Kentrum sp. DK TaxID=2126562 RepID=A0A450TIU6_9GAMM|nr:MAG: Methyltransferase domain-containing protein [Candidatus Kentron sp. DK]
MPDPAVLPGARRQLHRWLSCPSGRILLDREKALLDGVLPHLFGHYILQVGRLGDSDLLARSRISRRIVVTLEGDPIVPGYPALCAEPNALPVASDSVDVVVLPHLLEFSPDIRETLREAERVLVAEGHLLLLGFNAWSLVGIWHLLCTRGDEGRHSLPCQGGRFPGLTLIKDTITGFGFDITSVERYFFRPPASNPHLMERLRFLDTFGPRFWPFFSGAYFIVAKKRITTLTPIKQHRQRPGRPLIPVGLGEPSARHPASHQLSTDI